MLTCQVFVGAFLGIAAQFVLAAVVIFYVLPWMGLELLDTARGDRGVRSAHEGVGVVVGQPLMRLLIVAQQLSDRVAGSGSYGGEMDMVEARLECS